METNFEQILKWRYATKKFDASKKVSQELVDKIVEAARLAPTSSGLQPMHIFEIRDQAIKDQLVAVSMGQKQVAEASHVLVFAAWDNYTAERIDGAFQRTANLRGQSPEVYGDYVGLLKSVYLNREAGTNFNHAAHQAYIAMAYATLMAAELQVDSVPMEGFDPEAVDKLLGLREKGLRSVLLLPLGYRDAANDYLVNLAKVRQSKDEFVTVL